jgi:predicted DNA-binding protein (MmcQ/YjbR family)
MKDARPVAGSGGRKPLLLEVCRGLPGATEDVKWQDHLVFSVGGRMFAIFDVGESEALRILVDAAVFPILTRHAGVEPAPYLARHGWIKLSDLGVLPEAQLLEQTKEAHQIAAEKLSKKARARLRIG